MVAYDGSLATTIAGDGFLALRFNGLSQYFNNSGDTIRLVDATGTVLDSYTYSSSVAGKSDARIPDGIGAWVDPIPTPNAANVLLVSEQLYVVPDAGTASTSPTTSPSVDTSQPSAQIDLVPLDDNTSSGDAVLPAPKDVTEPEDTPAPAGASSEPDEAVSDSAEPTVSPVLPPSTESAQSSEPIL
jgi:hypothetical protein